MMFANTMFANTMFAHITRTQNTAWVSFVLWSKLPWNWRSVFCVRMMFANVLANNVRLCSFMFVYSFPAEYVCVCKHGVCKHDVCKHNMFVYVRLFISRTGSRVREHEPCSRTRAPVRLCSFMFVYVRLFISRTGSRVREHESCSRTRHPVRLCSLMFVYVRLFISLLNVS